MCQEGLLTEEQLEHALSVQGSTGRPLGEVIVTLGYASAGAVANALAEQYGGTLRTEYGVSAGLGRLRTTPPAPSTQATGAVAEAQPVADPAGMTERARAAEERVEALEARLAEVQQVAAGAIAARERADSAERELEGLRTRMTELDGEVAASREAVAELTAKLQAADQPEGASPAAAEKIEALEAQVAELEQLAAGAVAARERADSAERELEGLRNRVAELTATIEAAGQQEEEASRAAAEMVEALEARVAELEELAAGAVAARERADSAERELEGLRNRVAELDAELGASRDAVSDLTSGFEAADQPEEPSRAAAEKVEALEALAELDAELGVSREAVADLTAGLQSTDQPEEPPEEEHLLFVPSVAGYSLARRAGACPEPGTLVEDGGRAFVVARIGPSPLGGRLRCAYLEPAH